VKALADNDVLYKGSCLGVLDQLVGHARSDVGVLGAAKYVLRKRIKKARLQRSPTGVVEALEQFVRDAQIIEPTDEEQQAAAALELLAQREGLQLDSGESQLSAVLIARGIPELFTGDKRAIVAMERLLDTDAWLQPVQGRVRCLEQLVRLLIDRTSIAGVRDAVCAEPFVDRALAMCFSCNTGMQSTESVLEGLASYIEDVRRVARRVLAQNP
jgi:hypothetical protein